MGLPERQGPPPDGPPEERPAGPALVARLGQLLQLKELPRAGWGRVGVSTPESVADHSFGVALLAALLCPPGLDREKVLLMAILHDLAEVVVGDLTPHDGVPPDEKHAREAAAIEELLAGWPELRALWEDCDTKASPEARFVKRLDRLDLGLTARRYAERGFDVAELLRTGEPEVASWEAEGAAVGQGGPGRGPPTR